MPKRKNETNVIDANWKKLTNSGHVKQNNTKKRSTRYDANVAALREKVKQRGDCALVDWTKKYNNNAKNAKFVALDCEMVSIAPKNQSGLAKVCVVDHDGAVLYESFCKPIARVTDFRTRWSGVRPRDIVNAPTFFHVQMAVADIIRGKILIGHAIHNDLEALQLKHPPSLIRDTAKYDPLKKKIDTQDSLVTRKLKDLVLDELKAEIQKGEHDPYIDARAALELYKKHATEWETFIVKHRKNRNAERKSVKRKQQRIEEERGAADSNSRFQTAAERGDIFARGPKRHKRD